MTPAPFEKRDPPPADPIGDLIQHLPTYPDRVQDMLAEGALTLHTKGGGPKPYFRTKSRRVLAVDVGQVPDPGATEVRLAQARGRRTR